MKRSITKFPEDHAKKPLDQGIRWLTKVARAMLLVNEEKRSKAAATNRTLAYVNVKSFIPNLYKCSKTGYSGSTSVESRHSTFPSL